MKRSGIKQVAAAAGVSVATASHVLSGTGRPSEATRKRVLEVADALGFIRDASAARLRTGKSNLVGVILNNIVNPFFSELVASLEATVYEAGGLTLLAAAQNDLVRQERLLASMVAQGVGSVILSPVHGSTAEDLTPVLAHGLRLVVCVRDVVGSKAAFVGFDNIPQGRILEPELTTVDIRPALIGRTSAEIALRKAPRHGEPEPRHRLDPSLVRRNSVISP